MAARPGTRRTGPHRGPTPGRCTASPRRRSRSAPSTTRAISACPSPGTTVSVACPCSIFGGTVPPAADSATPDSVELGMKFRSEIAGTINGIRFYKVGGQHRHPRRQSLVGRRHPARRRRPSPARARIGLAAGDVLETGPDPGQHHLRRRLPGAERPLRGHRFGAEPSTRHRRRQPRQPAPARHPRRRQRQRPLSVHAGKQLPDQLLPGRELLGRRPLHAGPDRSAARSGYGRKRDRWHRFGDGVVVAADQRWHGFDLPHHPRHRRRRPDPGNRQRPGQLEDDLGPQRRHPLHLHRGGDQRRRRRARVRGLQPGDAVGADGARGADRRQRQRRRRPGERQLDRSRQRRRQRRSPATASPPSSAPSPRRRPPSAPAPARRRSPASPTAPPTPSPWRRSTASAPGRPRRPPTR